MSAASSATAAPSATPSKSGAVDTKVQKGAMVAMAVVAAAAVYVF
jgi:hypothetical protein